MTNVFPGHDFVWLTDTLVIAYYKEKYEYLGGHIVINQC
jgi:hypothetical protein